MSNFDILFANSSTARTSNTIPRTTNSTINNEQTPLHQICPHLNVTTSNTAFSPASSNNNVFLDNSVGEDSFNIIREVLSMLNGLNVETVKKNPNDLFMLFKYRNDIRLDDACCQMIIRIGGVGKLLLKILNYLNYYNLSRGTSTLLAYPMFDEDIETKTLGNIKQYFVNSIRTEIKEYHYHLLMIESKYRSIKIHYSFVLRRIMLWSSEWMNKFLFLMEILKVCIDFKGIALLNLIYDYSRNGDLMIQKMARSILHQSLKPFIFNMFDWLLYGEIDSEKIDQDFFIKIKDKSTTMDDPLAKIDPSVTNKLDNDGEKIFQWKSYELNLNMLPIFMCQMQMKKIYFIGNSIRLLRYMIKNEFDQRMVNEIFSNSQIQINYDIIKKFLYKNIETLSSCDKFFFEHHLVDDFDLLLESYYEVINEEMFKLLNMNKIKTEFELLLSYVLVQRGDFYESLIDYLFPLLRKPATEVINIINNVNCNNLHRMFNIFMVNSKLIDMHQVYKIDSLLYNNLELNDNLVFTFTRNVLKHHSGWDCFLVRYTFSKNAYRVMFDSQMFRYERLFRQLFYYKRVLYSIRMAQNQIMHFNSMFKGKNSISILPMNISKIIVRMLNILHFLFFHMFGFSSRMYRYFGNQIDSLWSNMFELVFKQQKQKNIEKIIRAHEKFLRSIEKVVFFNEDLELLTAYSALNDSIIDFCETFCEDDLFSTLYQLESDLKSNNTNNTTLGNINVDILEEQFFKHQFKITIIISKYRCCIKKFIHLSQNSRNYEFKYDLLTYQPCLDEIFSFFNSMRKSKTSNNITNKNYYKIVAICPNEEFRAQF